MDNLKKGVIGIAVAVTMGTGGAVVIDATQQAVPLDCVLTETPIQDLDKVMREYKIDQGFLAVREMTVDDRASIKGCEIAKTVEPQLVERSQYKIEIVKVEKIERGVQVYARAWDKNGEQIGFGVDGTVDIERFVIGNPPVLVPDENGPILRTQEANEFVDYQEFRFREDTEEALLQTLEHTIKVMGNKHDSKKIIANKQGNSTLTEYPQFDGYASRVNSGSGQTWGNIIAGNGTNNNSTDTTFGWILSGYLATGASTNFDLLRRPLLAYNTSAIGSGGTINSGTWSGYVTSKADEFSVDPTMTIMAGTLASFTAIASADYQGTFSNQTAWATAKTYANFTTSAYNDFTLNASGLAGINKTGTTTIGIRFAEDITGGTTPQQATGAREFQVIISSMDHTGTTQDPKLVLDYTSGGGGSVKRQTEFFF